MRTSKRRAQSGFTLLELVIAVSLSAIVLVGVFSMGASMVQYEAEGMRKGSINAWSLASLDSMNREIESASALVYPNTGGADTVVICNNWSRLGAVVINATLPSYVVYFCWDTTNNALRRFQSANGAACPASFGYVPMTCNAANYGTASTVATGVYRDTALDSIFTADTTVSTGTVRIRYVVGNPAGGVSPNEGNGLTNFANPQTMAFDTRITLDKASGNGSD